MPPSLILRLDISGTPIRWIPWQEAVSLYAQQKVSWAAGERVFKINGGISRLTGKQSSITINSIIAIRRKKSSLYINRNIPPLTNSELFLRDSNLCMYCGESFHDKALTRDHVKPLSKGGKNHWANVVTACRPCNVRKGNRTPEKARMPLLAIPYIPNWAEYLALSNRKILADQMDFLRARFSKLSMLLSSSH